MSKEIELHDIAHFYRHFLQQTSVKSITCLQQLCDSDIFPRFLHTYTPIRILFEIQNPITAIDAIYTTTPKQQEILNLLKHNPKLLFTRHKCKVENYVAIPISINLWTLQKGSLLVEYPHIESRNYNFNMTAMCNNNGIFSTQANADSDIWYGIRSADTKFTKSDVIIQFNKNNKTTILTSPTVCREDMRFFVFQNTLYGSYTRIDPYISGTKTRAALTVGRFSAEGDLVEEIVPQYGGNLINEPEKNWTWWESPYGKLHCVYTFTPLKILEFSSLRDVPTEITIPVDLADTIRGGAAGVIYNDKVWCFTHVHREGRINVGVVVLSYSNLPIVLGYCNTLVEASDYTNLFFYICGAYLDTNTRCWKLTGGAQDTKSCIITIPYDEVMSKIHWV